MNDDDKKLTPAEYNEIIRHFVDGTSPPPAKKVKQEDNYCYHNWVPYTGLIKRVYICTMCPATQPYDEPTPVNPWNHDDDGSF